jgi:hypothetical protein
MAFCYQNSTLTTTVVAIEKKKKRLLSPIVVCWLLSCFFLALTKTVMSKLYDICSKCQKSAFVDFKGIQANLCCYYYNSIIHILLVENFKQ